jgi:hypothetical protein
MSKFASSLIRPVLSLAKYNIEKATLTDFERLFFHFAFYRRQKFFMEIFFCGKMIKDEMKSFFSRLSEKVLVIIIPQTRLPGSIKALIKRKCK